jgi:hypothetical protein
MRRAKSDPDAFVVAAEKLNVILSSSVVAGHSVWDLLHPRRTKALGARLRISGLEWTVMITVLITSWIDFSRLHEFLNSDSIVPVLASLVKWTPFYWGQNRFGMLIPLLAVSFHSPLANLLFQAWLGTFAGLFASFLLLRYVMGNRPTWLLAGALVNLTALCLLPLWAHCDWFVNQPYGVSLTLGLSAFILLEKAGIFRWTLAIVLMLLAHWVNIAVFTLLAPLAVLHYFAEKQQSDLTRLLPCLSLGALGGWLVMRASPDPESTRLGLIQPAEWPRAWTHFVLATHRLIPPNPYQLLWLIIPAVAAVILLLTLAIPQATRYFRLAAVLAAVGLMNWFFMGTLIWVRSNAYFPRYAYPALLFATAALAVLEAPLLEMTAGSKRALVILTILMFAVVDYRYGTPSIARVRQVLDQRFGQLTEEILTTHAAVVAGNYWTVWPAVFHANLVLYERGEQEVVYGLTDRSYVTDQLWADIPRNQLCVAGPVNDVKTGEYMDQARIRFPRLENHDRVTIFAIGDESSCHRSSKTETPLQWMYRHL